MSPAGIINRDSPISGFTLLEAVCVLAIIGMLAGILLPSIPTGTSEPRLNSYAVDVASLLVADRNAAIREKRAVAAEVDALSRSIRSGASKRIIQLPDDVELSASLATRCNGRQTSSSIVFFASGMSCGGIVSLLRARAGYEVRINWLTGGVEIVPHRAS